MDDGYWESLLRDVENTARVPRPASEEEILPGPALAESYHEWRPRSSADEAGDDEADWARAEELLGSGETLTLKITGYNRGGLLADFGAIQGFAPASHLLAPPVGQLPAQRIAAMAARIGESMDFRVIEIDRERRRLILSERCARKGERVEELLARLQVGAVCHGPVTNLCAFGAFVDLGGFEGLIHISELSWGRINTPDEIVRPGEQVEVVVLDINLPAQKVALSLKRLRPDPWQGVEDRYRVGEVIEGVITNVVPFGAFARLEEGLEGLIHVSELAEGNFMDPRNVVNEGDRVRVRVLAVDGAHHRLALSMRSQEPGGRKRPGDTSQAPYPS